MVDKKSKTKAAMMQELESIKGLLLEDDEIPILQEVFDSDTNSNASQDPLSRRELDELHDQFTALSRSIGSKNLESHDSSKHLTAPQTSASLLDAFTRVSQQHPPTTTQPATQQSGSSPKIQQPSLFQEELVVDIDEYDRSLNSESSPAQSTIMNSNSLGDFHQNSQVQRHSLAKASGENPFLPQHIRARLHGNNPPPLFEHSGKSKTEAHPEQKRNSPYHEQEPEQKSSSQRQQLINDVIAAVMPQLEKELQLKLERLSQQELEQLRSHDAT